MTLAVLGALLGLVGLTGAAWAVDGRADDPVGRVPDVTMLVEGVPIGDAESVIQSLTEVEGIGRVTVDPSDGDLLVHLALDDGPERDRPLGAVVAGAETVLDRETGGAVVAVGGLAVADRELADRFDRVAWALAALGGVLGLSLGAVFGWRRGAVAGGALAAAVALAGTIGRQVAGDFDGTMAGTALPAALAGLAVGVALVLRLLVWFRHPRGDDGAETIRAAIEDPGSELVLALAGLVATAAIVDLLHPGRSAMVVAVAGILVTMAVVAAVVVPALTMLVDDPPGPRAGAVPLSSPDLAIGPLLVGFGLLLLTILSVAATGRVGGALLGVEQFDADSEIGMVAAAVERNGGDPTSALVAVNETTTDEEFARWAIAVADRAEVAWIDLGPDRITATGVVAESPSRLLSDPEVEDVAVIVLAVGPRSVEAQGLVDRLPPLSASDGGPRLIGQPALAAGLVGSRLAIVVAIVGLALTGALGVVALTGNRAIGLVSFGLRLLGGGATVGLHNLVVGDPALAPALTTLVAVGAPSLLAELELIRRVAIDAEPGAWDQRQPETRYRAPVPSAPGALDGQFGSAGVAALILGGLVVLTVGGLAGGSGTTTLGLGLILASAIEVIVVIVALRSTLLAQRPPFQTLSRPMRIVLHGRRTGDPDAEEPADDDPQWREVVADLLQTEFRLQADPTSADLDLVFEPGTPVHAQAAERCRDLVGAELRVAGRSPRLHRLRTYRDHLPAIVTVTVDHPERQLLDRNGDVVGVRAGERRVGRLWLAPDQLGRFRIVESIELGSGPLDDGEATAPESDARLGRAAPTLG